MKRNLKGVFVMLVLVLAGFVQAQENGEGFKRRYFHSR